MNFNSRKRDSGWIISEPPGRSTVSVTAQFDRIVRKFPRAAAVTIGRPDGPPTDPLTYAELDARSEALARTLVAAGVKPGDRVGVTTARTSDVVIALLGILRAGGAYVPLDPSYPQRRLAFMRRDSGVRVMVVSPGLAPDLAGDDIRVVEIGAAPAPDDVTLPSPDPTDPAYLIYTSGSTGEPKGVVTPHRAIVRLTVGSTYTRLGPDRRILQLAPISFDAATFEIWGALLNGGAVVIYPDSGLPDFKRLGAVLKAAEINTLWLTSALFNAIVDSDLSVLSGVEELLVGGEALSVEHVRRANAGLSAQLINGYGPTETTTFACCHRIPRDLPADLASIPIGQPISGVAVAILDDDLNPVAEGQAGELCIAGSGLALGYHDRPTLTSERFIINATAPGGRFYRTGDQVRTLPGGEIEYLGRTDTQVKVAGQRIELGEIEQVLKTHPQVADAAVAVDGASWDQKRIAAWIVPADRSALPEVGQLRAFVEERLPKAMIPAVFTPLETLPLTAVGKLDRAALTVPRRERPALEQPFAAPRGELERFVADSWRELLGVEQVGRHDRFFELGGASMMVQRFLDHLRSHRGLSLSVAEFFDGPTVADIARIAGERAAPAPTARPTTAERATNDTIAIVGLAGRFAGAPDVARFWDMILEGRSGRREVTREDLIAAGEDPALLDDPDYVAAAFPLDEAESFDAAFFGFKPREAQLMDPQQRILLEAAWTALEDAGIDPKQSADRVGVFGGVGRNAYLLNNLMSHSDLREAAGEYDMLIGNERDFASTHIAYRLGLHGPALTVQTACSTSGVAVHMAAESLRRGECDLALAGGAKVLSPTRVGYRYVEGGPLSPDGFVRAFDAEASGMVRGSGVAMAALKRLDDALRDGDHVYATLIGSAINNDGETKAGFTAPSVSGQAEVIAQAHAAAGVTADTVTLIEAHGTGTILGDPIEVEGLTRAFRQSADQTGYCALGSVKTNIGHLDAGATAASLIKAALSLQNEIIPPSLNFRAPNPRIDFAGSPFFVPGEPVEWKRGTAPRRAGVSSFGLGGTNVHLLLEEAPARPAPDPTSGPQLLVLSARTDAALARRCADLADWLERRPDANLADVAYTLMVGRRRFEKRVALACADRDDAIAKLRRMAPGEVLRGGTGAESSPVAFLFPGGGSQYAGMARDLYDAHPVFRAALDDVSAAYERRAGCSLVEAIRQADGAFEAPAVALPALFAVEYAMARLWLSWGIEPSAMIGHSMGEYTTACVAGVFSLDDAVEIVMCRGRLFETLDAGGMLSVPLTEAALRERLTPDLSIAAVNRDDQCVVSGPVDAIAALGEALLADGVETRRVHINVAAHSSLVEPILAEFREQFATIKLNAPNRPFLSNLTGDWITDAEATDPDYWVRHLRSTVRFADGIARLLEDPDRVFLEVGPGQVLSTFVRQNARRGAGHDVIATIRHPQESGPDTDFLMGAVGRFWLAGGKLDWASFVGGQRRRVPLPTYPFERTRLWIDPIAFAKGDDARTPAPTAATVVALPGPSTEPTFATRHERILALLKSIIGKLSGLPLERIDAHATFLELGFDSLFLTQANAAFKKAFKIKMTTRQLIETTPFLDALAGHLDHALAPDAEIGAVEAPATAAPATSAAGGPAQIRSEDSPGRPVVKKAAAAGLTAEQERYIDDLIATTTRRTPKAKAETQASRGVLADPRTVQGFRSRWKEMVYPVLSDRAKGSKVWDVDGNEYIDLVGGYGVTMFGHQPPFVVEAVKAQLDRTLAIGPQSVLAAEVARLVSDMTGMERVAFCNTGSEAVLAAVRMARTVTGKSKIAKFDGHYHGIFDEMQVRGSGTGSRKATLPSAPGIPAEAIQNTIILDYGDPDAFNVIRENADDLALVLVEPVRSRNPDYQPKEYLQQLRKVTEELGVPLLFDEIVTGFRCDPGGAQAVFGVRADLATYGKVAGGGLPIGIVTGSAQFMDTLDGGQWTFGDDSVPTSDMTWFAGTFVRHPMALAATKATLEHMKAEGPALQATLNARSTKLVGELNAFLQSVRAPIKVEHFASVLRVTFTEHQEYADLLFFELRNRGILTYEGRPIFLTTAHSDADLAAFRDAFIDSLRALMAVGLMDGRDPEAVRRIPMVTGQQEIWVSAQFSPEASCSYNLCSTLKLSGPLDINRLQEALNALADRHEALRTTPDRDGLSQTIRPRIDVPLTVKDLRAGPDAERIARIEAARREQVTTPFDLLNGPLVRSQVLRLADDEHLFLFTVHHVIADGWSCGVLLRDLGEIYAGRGADLEPADQLSDFVRFMRLPDQIETRAESREYWLNLYGGALPRVAFPADRPRPRVRDYSARRIELPLAPEVVSGLRKTARENGTTLFAALIGGFAAYLTRLTGVADNPIGFSAAGQPLMGGKALVGHCVNFLPLRLSTDLSQGFGTHLRGIGTAVLDALEHQNFDFLSFVQDVQPHRDGDWAPLVSVGVNLDPSAKSMAFADLGVEAGSVGRAYENLDLFLNFVETNADVELQATFNTALFDDATMRRRMAEYLRFLAAAAADPETSLDALEILSDEDRRQLLIEWNGVESDYPRDAALADIFRGVADSHAERTALWVARTPDAPLPDHPVTYAELDRLSDGWAARLQSRGVRPGAFVGVHLPRSQDLIVAMLAVLKAGAAYVPIEPGTPATRIQLMLDTSGAAVLLTHEDIAESAALRGVDRLAMDVEPVTAEVPAAEPAPRAGGDPAYVMYTSGSTGTPKGVVVPQRAVSRLVLGNSFARLDDTRVIAHLAPSGFDASTFEIWGALLNGGALVVVPAGSFPTLSRLAEILETRGVTTLWLTAALFNTIVDESPTILEPVEELITGGEALSVAHVSRALAALPNTTLINGYGPTENTTFSCGYRIPRGFDPGSPSVPIGRPINNSLAYVVDAQMRLVPPGVPGELVVGGDGLALGYLQRPDLTDALFVPDTISKAAGLADARLYRTGDICRHRPDGSLEFLGRRDAQIKIRGFRIEPGEVEATLEAVAGVRQAVLVQGPGAESGLLTAFVVPVDQALTTGRLNQILRDQLPRHLVPARIRIVQELPVSNNGKIDRKALLGLAVDAQDDQPDAAPQTATEMALAGIWTDLLQRPILSIDESFFALGGHSLMAVRLFDRVRRRFGADLPISTLFSHPTIRELADLVDRRRPTEASGAVTTDPEEDWDTTTVVHPGPETGATPLVIVGGAGGNLNNLIELGTELGRHRSVIGVQTRGILGHTPRETIEAMAAENIGYLRRRQPAGPYLLAGYSAGAQTAFEMARQLTAAGEVVSEVFLLDTFAPGFAVGAGATDALSNPIRLTLAQRLRNEGHMIAGSGLGHLGERLSATILEILLRGPALKVLEIVRPTFARSRRARLAWYAAARRYQGGAYGGTVSLVVSKAVGLREELLLAKYPYLGWNDLADPARITRMAMDCGHLDMVKSPNAQVLAAFIEARIAAVHTAP